MEVTFLSFFVVFIVNPVSLNWICLFQCTWYSLHLRFIILVHSALFQIGSLISLFFLFIPAHSELGYLFLTYVLIKLDSNQIQLDSHFRARSIEANPFWLTFSDSTPLRWAYTCIPHHITYICCSLLLYSGTCWQSRSQFHKLALARGSKACLLDYLQTWEGFCLGSNQVRPPQ